MWGANVDQLLADENASGDVYWALTDHLNTVHDWAEYDDPTDTTSVANHITYDAFGNVLSETNATLDTTGFGFTARYFDEATGLQYNTNRWYNAQVGRWMSQDPIGFDGRDENLYRYVGNGPAIFIDPFGLEDRTWGQYFYQEWHPWGFGETRGREIGEGIGAVANAPAATRRFFSRLESTNRLKGKVYDMMSRPESISARYDGPTLDDLKNSRRQMMDQGKRDFNEVVKEGGEGAYAAAELTEACVDKIMLLGAAGAAKNLAKEGIEEGAEALADAAGRAARNAAEEAGEQAGRQADNLPSHFDAGRVPGPNPNNLRQRSVNTPTAGEGGVYLKPENGKTKIGSTGDFQARYGNNPSNGIEVEIPQTRTGPAADDSAYPWTPRRQRRFDEEYLDRLTPDNVKYRAPDPNAKPPVSQAKWEECRHIFGYGDLPADFGF